MNIMRKDCAEHILVYQLICEMKFEISELVIAANTLIWKFVEY